jgi:hypothetical protein
MLRSKALFSCKRLSVNALRLSFNAPSLCWWRYLARALLLALATCSLSLLALPWWRQLVCVWSICLGARVFYVFYMYLAYFCVLASVWVYNMGRPGRQSFS